METHHVSPPPKKKNNADNTYDDIKTSTYMNADNGASAMTSINLLTKLVSYIMFHLSTLNTKTCSFNRDLDATWINIRYPVLFYFFFFFFFFASCYKFLFAVDVIAGYDNVGSPTYIT
ncbi:uncharacterized protein EV154DRAFT_257623 [Mucor mucedo]|uniref:uncharacterized protein n=1 Tax=Mucor mucedo TaxID=29922 RepID=UPI00221EF52A|nr:uncharacterized protein EV154DRAFT_257623 [Mucor mucedo]KAI7896174.1 hypothetical protein EV154DRAFT_257623 [Mucor mucedo]